MLFKNRPVNYIFYHPRVSKINSKTFQIIEQN